MRVIPKDQLGMQMIHKDQLKCDTKTSPSPEAWCKLLGATLQVTYILTNPIDKTFLRLIYLKNSTFPTLKITVDTLIDVRNET